MKILYFSQLILGILIFSFFAFFRGFYLLSSFYYLMKYNVISPMPIEKFMKTGKASEEEIRFFKRIELIREFGKNELGLKDNQSYKSYSRENPTIYLLTASRKTSFEGYTWYFPFFGNSPYLGFYNIESLKKEQSRLIKKGFDVHISGVMAFSTLGILKDPLFEYMTKYSDAELAEMILHEELHATLWIKGSFTLNENIADFVGEKGAIMFLKKEYGDEKYSKIMEDIKEEEEDRKNYRKFLNDIYNELDILYKSEKSDEEKLKLREEIYNKKIEFLKKNYSSYFHSQDYRFLQDTTVNNAFISIFRTYSEKRGDLDNLYCYFKNDIGALIYFLKKEKKNLKTKIENILKEKNEDRICE